MILAYPPVMAFRHLANVPGSHHNTGAMNGVAQRDWPRRRYPRFTLDRPLLAHLYCEESFALTYRGRCREFSEGGIGAALAEQLPVGEVVTLELSPTLKVYGAVRYLSGFYHGFEFVLLRDRQKEAIKAICASFERRHHHHAAKRAHA
ncbi:MAG TPA: PilZ domain-containing protein [Terriglobales bacterium]|nr:PilZ domain-containing protein [Terriglobales bacterium]